MAVNSDQSISENKYALNYYEEEALRLDSFKNTYKATCFNDGHVYAIRKVAVSEQSIGYCTKELEILKKLDKTFIVPYDEWWTDHNYYVKQNYQDVNTNFNYGSLYLSHFSHLLHIKLPLYSLTLKNIIDALRDNYFDNTSNRLSACGYFVASQLFIDITTGLNYLHQLNPPIFHRNLKPENIMITLDGNTPDNFVRLSDIGLTALDSDHNHTVSQYNAPEVYNFRQFSAKSDVYSLGVIAYQLFFTNFCSTPRSHGDLLQVKYHHLTNIVNRLMSLSIEKRQTCAEILSNANSWSLSFNDVREDPTVVAIVTRTKQIDSKQDKFIELFIQSKSKQNLACAASMMRQISESSNSGETLSPIKIPEPQKIYVFPKPSPHVMFPSNKKPIFISYARKDASPHARNLKTWLNNYGCDVYLDVDEIKVGNDWMDDLNNAVISCVLFVALVTPVYGCTRWTKKEIQLADTLNKPIIPVSFIDNWPPVQIALNLGATNYIPWKTDAEIKATTNCDKVDGSVYDIRHWNEPYVDRTAKEIAEKLRVINQQRNWSPLVSNTKPFTASLNWKPKESLNWDHNIVISCHPNQHQFANRLRDELTKFMYKLWLSSDDQSINNSSTDSDEYVPQESMSKSFASYPSSDSLDKFSSSGLNKIRFQSSLSQVSNNRYKFREKINKASVVILILSEEYCNSQTSKQQAYYCYQRVPIIAIKYDNFQLPYELTKVYEEENIFDRDDDQYDDFAANLKKKIDRLAVMTKNKFHLNKFNGFDDQMYYLAHQFKTEQSSLFDGNNIIVYISSSGQPLSTRAQSILSAIGKHLASIPMLKLITGDFNGGDQIIVNSFINETLSDSNVYHILPVGVSAPKAQTLHVGESVKERNSVVSQLFNFCLLIDNGDEAIRVAENFSWNDKFVIPVIVEELEGIKHSPTPQSITDIPNGVKVEDWNTLFDSHITADNLAIAVNNVITSMAKTLGNLGDDELYVDKQYQ